MTIADGISSGPAPGTESLIPLVDLIQLVDLIPLVDLTRWFDGDADERAALAGALNLVVLPDHAPAPSSRRTAT